MESNQPQANLNINRAGVLQLTGEHSASEITDA